MVKSLKFFVRTIPFVSGLILTLTSLAFLVEFAGSPSLESLSEEDFVSFAILALLGVPLLLLGIRRLAEPRTR